MIHTNMSCTVFLLLCELKQSAILWSQTKLRGIIILDVKGKPSKCKACLCGSLYSTFKTSFKPFAFYNKWFKTLFIDQLARSKATCSLKVHLVCRCMNNVPLSLIGLFDSAWRDALCKHIVGTHYLCSSVLVVPCLCLCLCRSYI